MTYTKNFNGNTRLIDVMNICQATDFRGSFFYSAQLLTVYSLPESFSTSNLSSLKRWKFHTMMTKNADRIVDIIIFRRRQEVQVFHGVIKEISIMIIIIMVG